MSVNVRTIDLQLTSLGFFSVVEQYIKVSTNQREAYDKTIEYCMENNYSITYSTYESFKSSYYRFMRDRERKYS